jgi:hypothetical protein
MAALDTDTGPPDPNGWGPFSAGHSAAGVDAIVTVDELIARIEREALSTLDEMRSSCTTELSPSDEHA